MIRIANPTDVCALAAIEAACFPVAEAATPEQIARRVEQFGPYFLVQQMEGQIVGFVNGMCTNEPDLRDAMYEDAGLHDPDGNHVMIFGLDTLPGWQHQGVAKTLMRSLIEQAKRDRKTSIVLTCKKRLVSFYEQFGYRNEGLSAATHGDVEWFQMRLPLRPVNK